MTDTMTFQNIDLSSWDILYIHIHKPYNKENSWMPLGLLSLLQHPQHRLTLADVNPLRLWQKYVVLQNQRCTCNELSPFYQFKAWVQVKSVPEVVSRNDGPPRKETVHCMITSPIDNREAALYKCMILLKLKRLLSLVFRPGEQQIGKVCEQDGEGEICYWTGGSKIFIIWSVLLCSIQEHF